MAKQPANHRKNPPRTSVRSATTNVAVPTPKTRPMAAATRNKPAAATKPKQSRAPKALRGPSKPRAGGLTAAAALLAKTGKAMKCQEMTECLMKSGAWTPEGKTPAATLAAAIGREIATKGSASRFKKVDRGVFAAS